MSTRRRFSGEFKGKVTLDASRGDKTIRETATRHKVHLKQVRRWGRPAVDGMQDVFFNGRNRLVRTFHRTPSVPLQVQGRLPSTNSPTASREILP